MKKKIVIVVPEYNEGELAVKTIKNILKISKNQVVVVDDGSINKSFEMLQTEFQKNRRVYLLRHLINLGKGASMRTGVRMAWRLKAGAVIFIDADGQHNPNLLPKFEKALTDGFPTVFGYRQLDNQMPWVRKYGNLVAKKILNILFGLKRKEFLCGFLGFNKSVYKKLRWQSDRYGVETEIATKVARHKIDFMEIEIDTIYIDKYKGVTLFDALKILTRIPYWYFRK
ncbi:glycosyltransferase family 2 protein [Candidatus Shapirobacteria bacterium]|nr:glycosyltransferase family 2 protein [Candidatus Shapirobacteria bacterium]